MKNVYIFLIDGFEEIEALGTIDILRRAGIAIQSVSLEAGKRVVSAHGIAVESDILFPELDAAQARLLIIPGGTPKYDQHDGLKKTVAAFAKDGNPIAAICAAPVILGGLGLLKGKKATVYPAFTQYLEGAEVLEEAVVVDGNITTGRGPGLTFDFALELVRQLEGSDKQKQVAAGLLIG